MTHLPPQRPIFAVTQEKTAITVARSLLTDLSEQKDASGVRMTFYTPFDESVYVAKRFKDRWLVRPSDARIRLRTPDLLYHPLWVVLDALDAKAVFIGPPEENEAFLFRLGIPTPKPIHLGSLPTRRVSERRTGAKTGRPRVAASR